MNIDEMRQQKAKILAKRNKDAEGLITGVRNEMLNMKDCITLYKRTYSNIELTETFERWAQDLRYAEDVIDNKQNHAPWEKYND